MYDVAILFLQVTGKLNYAQIGMYFVWCGAVSSRFLISSIPNCQVFLDSCLFTLDIICTDFIYSLVNAMTSSITFSANQKPCTVKQIFIVKYFDFTFLLSPSLFFTCSWIFEIFSATRYHYIMHARGIILSKFYWQ